MECPRESRVTVDCASLSTYYGGCNDAHTRITRAPADKDCRLGQAWPSVWPRSDSMRDRPSRTVQIHGCPKLDPRSPVAGGHEYTMRPTHQDGDQDRARRAGCRGYVFRRQWAATTTEREQTTSVAPAESTVVTDGAVRRFESGQHPVRPGVGQTYRKTITIIELVNTRRRGRIE
ncbi:hypothetical protein HSRCO_0427 [Halanaeroarchaeum sp. HSR-CO]|nr:hypothetical protein HSRCO_0427 [Halanaeroarchaeum sp. HSR-CO]